MAIIKLGADYKRQGFTQVDNVFINEFLTEANGDDVRIYIAGLYLAETLKEGDFIEKLSSILNLSMQRVREGFSYWEKKGIVERRSDDCIVYLSVKAPVTPIIKYNAQKFKVFTEEVVRIFPEKVLTPNEYNKYFEFMTTSGMAVNAMLLIMQYCKDMGGGRTGTEYVLTVAQAWAEDGLVTEKQVIERINEMENNREDLKAVFNVMGIKRSPDVEDRRLYSVWTKTYGYTLDAILTGARVLKRRGGMERLDNYVKELYSARAFSSAEIAEYAKKKEQVRTLCVTLCKNIGVYYADTEMLEKTYVTPWLNAGFDGEALEQISRYCFLRNARTFESVDTMVRKFEKLGIFRAQDISNYVNKQIKLDEKIKEVFDCCGYVGNVGNKDREMYKDWEKWGFEEDTILAVAKKFYNKNFPLSAMNKALGQLRINKIFDANKAIEFIEKSGEVKGNVDNTDYSKHMYTEEQLKKAFVNFENWD